MGEPVFEIYNDAGRLQFSLLARLPSCVAKGTHSSATNAGISNTPGIAATRLDISGLSEAGFIAIKPNGAQGFALTYVERVNGVNRYNFMTSTTTSTFDWWAFDYPPIQPTTSGVVFETYNDDGSVRAQLHNKPAVVAGFFSQAINASSLGDTSINVPTDRIFAVAIGMRAGYSGFNEIGTPDGQPQRYRFFYRLDMIYLANSTLRATLQTVDQSAGFTTSPTPNTYFGPRNNMILDVTSY